MSDLALKVESSGMSELVDEILLMVISTLVDISEEPEIEEMSGKGALDMVSDKLRAHVEKTKAARDAAEVKPTCL